MTMMMTTTTRVTRRPEGRSLNRLANLVARGRGTRAFLALAHFCVLVGLGSLACHAPTPSSRSKDFDELATLEGTAIAVADPRELVYVASGLDEAQLDELRTLAPNVRFLVGLRGEELASALETAHGADAHLLRTNAETSANNLRWAQAWSAGVDRYVANPLWARDGGPLLTNMAGVHGPAIADHVMAMLLSRIKNLDRWRDAMREGAWDRSRAEGMTSLAGKTLLVCGLGGIGTEVARRAKAFDMRVVATVRTLRDAPPFVDELGTDEAFERFLGEADVIAICLPLTEATRDLFDRDTLGRVKPGAILVNIARGPIVDTDALIAALDDGRLSAACLDVTDPEPLPTDHPLWQRDDVLITPHVAGRAEVTGERRWALFRENVRRFANGLPLLNVVDPASGY